MKNAINKLINEYEDTLTALEYDMSVFSYYNSAYYKGQYDMIRTILKDLCYLLEVMEK